MVSDFNKISTFMAIVKERSFSKASKTLGISQPAVTLQIKKLEDVLRATLITRKKNGILLTKEGEKFYKLCLKFEGSMVRFKEEASHIKDEKTPIIIGTTMLINDTILPLMLDKICAVTDNDLEVKITEQNNLLSYLVDRRCDFCVMNERIYNDQLTFKELFEYDIVLVSNKEFATKINVNELSKYRFIKDRNKTFLNGYFNQFGVKYDELSTAYILDGSVSVKSSMLYNKTKNYFAFLPKFMVAKELENKELFLVEIDNVKIVRQVYVVGLNENEDMVEKIGNLSFATSY